MKVRLYLEQLQIKKVLCLISTIVLTFSCGGEKSSEIFSSVELQISIDPPSVNADVAFWFDSDNDENNTCDEYTINPTQVNIYVSVKPLAGIDTQGVIPSPVSIDMVEIIYLPVSDSDPPIPKAYRFPSIQVNPDSQAIIPIEILSQQRKRNFIERDSSVLRPLPRVYSYNVILRFRVREIYSGDVQIIERGVFMEVSDFISDGEDCSL